MFRSLWYLTITAVACHAGWLRWKRVRGRRKQTANLQTATWWEVAGPTFFDTSSWISVPVKESGVWPTPTDISAPFNSLGERGPQPAHIPEQRTRFGPTMLDLQSPGSLVLPLLGAPETSPPAGGEGPSPDPWGFIKKPIDLSGGKSVTGPSPDWAHCPNRPCVEAKGCCWLDCPMEVKR